VEKKILNEAALHLHKIDGWCWIKERTVLVLTVSAEHQYVMVQDGEAVRFALGGLFLLPGLLRALRRWTRHAW